jgi:hypothetical protein
MTDTIAWKVEALESATLPDDVLDAWRSLTCLFGRQASDYGPAGIYEMLLNNVPAIPRNALARVDFGAEIYVLAWHLRQAILRLGRDREHLIMAQLLAFTRKRFDVPPEVCGPLEIYLGTIR